MQPTAPMNYLLTSGSNKFIMNELDVVEQPPPEKKDDMCALELVWVCNNCQGFSASTFQRLRQGAGEWRLVWLQLVDGRTSLMRGMSTELHCCTL